MITSVGMRLSPWGGILQVLPRRGGRSCQRAVYLVWRRMPALHAPTAVTWCVHPSALALPNT